MVKKVTLAILLGCIGIAVFLNTPYGKKLIAQKDIRTDQLSERSKQYIESQKDDNELWRTTDLSKKGPAKATVFDVDGCFTITIPYNIIATRKDGPCDYQINTGRPKTMIIAYSQKATISSLDDDPGIRLRRDRDEEYAESTAKIGNRSFLIFKKKVGAFEVNAFNLSGGTLLVVNMKTYTVDDFTNDFKVMLSSVQFTQ